MARISSVELLPGRGEVRIGGRVAEAVAVYIILFSSGENLRLADVLAKKSLSLRGRADISV
jgi:hypothetical protein